MKIKLFNKFLCKNIIIIIVVVVIIIIVIIIIIIYNIPYRSVILLRYFHYY